MRVDLLARTSLSIGSIRATALGEVWVAASPRGLVAVEFGITRTHFEGSLRRQLGPHVELRSAPDDPAVTAAACEIEEYLSGHRRTFGLPIDWSVLSSDFQRLALRAVIAIPYGETRSYGQIAVRIGRPQAPRAVGRANATNPMPLVIPCHRVVGSDGSLHGYGGFGGLRTKRWLLDLECEHARLPAR